MLIHSGFETAVSESKMAVVDYYDTEGWPVVVQYRQAAVKEQQKGSLSLASVQIRARPHVWSQMVDVV